MVNKNIHLVFFSPTGTTARVTGAVAKGTGGTVCRTLDLTPGAPEAKIGFAAEDVVIVAAPVYGGRLPTLAVERLKAISGQETSVIPIVVYGNRAFEDALLELSDLCEAQGFHTIAAGAFIAQHSFSSAALPIAVSRPDGKDLQRANQFGGQIAQILRANESSTQLEVLELPGNRPYKPAMGARPAATEVDLRLCTHCGKCVSLCPANAIRMTDVGPVTESCLWCLACLHNCPVAARTVVLPKVIEVAQRLHDTCQTRREPETFPAQPVDCSLRKVVGCHL
ncbi:MAG: EFR1 family ferrodoxin [Kiritimatiellae bacterium]|nr:EFR1 family ferrodoxin [Kiritimatiellia bacterium]